MRRHPRSAGPRSLKETLREQLRRDALDAKHFLGLAHLFADRGDEERAREYLEIAIAKDLPNPSPHKLFGRAAAQAPRVRARRAAALAGAALQPLRPRGGAAARPRPLRAGRPRRRPRRLHRRLPARRRPRARGGGEAQGPHPGAQGRASTGATSGSPTSSTSGRRSCASPSTASSGTASASARSALPAAAPEPPPPRRRQRPHRARGAAAPARRLEPPPRRADLPAHRGGRRGGARQGAADLRRGHAGAPTSTCSRRARSPSSARPPTAPTRSACSSPATSSARSTSSPAPSARGDAVAVQPCQLLRLDAHRLDEVIRRDPELGVQIYWSFWHNLAFKLRCTNEQLRTFFNEDAHAREPAAPQAAAQPRAAARPAVDSETKMRLFREQGLTQPRADGARHLLARAHLPRRRGDLRRGRRRPRDVRRARGPGADQQVHPRRRRGGAGHPRARRLLRRDGAHRRPAALGGRARPRRAR